jgi:hypothetical protein
MDNVREAVGLTLGNKPALTGRNNERKIIIIMTQILNN